MMRRRSRRRRRRKRMRRRKGRKRNSQIWIGAEFLFWSALLSGGWNCVPSSSS
jgi:hypothetical protein